MCVCLIGEALDQLQREGPEGPGNRAGRRRGGGRGNSRRGDRWQRAGTRMGDEGQPGAAGECTAPPVTGKGAPGRGQGTGAGASLEHEAGGDVQDRNSQRLAGPHPPEKWFPDSRSRPPGLQGPECDLFTIFHHYLSCYGKPLPTRFPLVLCCFPGVKFPGQHQEPWREFLNIPSCTGWKSVPLVRGGGHTEGSRLLGSRGCVEAGGQGRLSLACLPFRAPGSHPASR